MNPGRDRQALCNFPIRVVKPALKARSDFHVSPGFTALQHAQAAPGTCRQPLPSRPSMTDYQNADR
jgi:hypothetical protein